MHITENTPVLIVGGSLVGLSAAAFLASQGVPAIVVEKHTGTSTHPRAIGFTTRTVELFRSVGIELPATTGFNGPPRRTKAESLAGAWYDEYPWTERVEDPSVEFSPVQATAITQDRLEPILRARAIELGADVRLGTQLTEFTQDGDGITATLVRRDGSEYHLRASYLVATDGAGSTVRQALGIDRRGRGLLSVQRSILFTAPIDHYLDRGVVQFEIEQPTLSAFLTTYGDGRWVLMLADDVERDEDQQRDAVRRAVGLPDLQVDVITTGRWELAALIADRFDAGRVFLAGDAAHQLPPNRGGYGANTGIDDVHNLAWKLAAVLHGASAPRLLDTYDAERRPIAWLRHDQIFARQDYKAHVETGPSQTPVIDDVAMELGQLYRSAAQTGTAGDLPTARRPDEWAGHPGTRAPHLWVLGADGRTISTLDLFQRGWVLLSEDDRWRHAAVTAGREVRTQIGFVAMGDSTVVGPQTFSAAYGVEPGGAALVRPDGYVAFRWTTGPEDPAAALVATLRVVAAIPTDAVASGQRVEDVAAIEDLTARYADAVNKGWGGKTLDLARIPEIFATDARYSSAEHGTTVGADAIAAVLPAATAVVEFSMHAFLNPIIRVDGDTATGSWLMWIASIYEAEPGAVYASADMTYTRTPAGWRIQTVNVETGLRIPGRRVG